MPVFLDANGNETSDDGTAQESPPSIDDRIAQEHGAESSSDFLTDAGQFAALAANSATMGLAPALTGLVSKDKKNDILRYLEKSRQNLGGYGTAAEIGGAFLTPLPGLGAIAGVAKGATMGAKALRLAKVLGQGAAVGGVGGALGYAGNVAGGQFDLGDAGKAALTGAAIGAPLSGVGDKLGRILKDRAQRARFSAGGGTAGSIRKLGASGIGQGLAGQEAKADEVASTAMRKGWIGNAGDTVKDSVERSSKTARIQQKVLDDIYAKTDTKVLPADQLVSHVRNELESKLTRGGQLSKENTAVIDRIEESLNHSLGFDPGGPILGVNGKPVIGPSGKPLINSPSYKTDVLSAADVRNTRHNIKDIVWGTLGVQAPKDTVVKQAQGRAAMVLSDLENKLVDVVTPGLGDQLKKAKTEAHHAMLWEAMGRASNTSEKGLLELGTGRGLRSIPDTAVMHTMLAPLRAMTGGIVGGPITSQVLAGAMMGSGQNANNIIALQKTLQKARPQNYTGKFDWNQFARGRPTLQMSKLAGEGYAR